MVCSAWFRERLRKVSSKKENDMVQDIDIKSKRILLFDFDGTLVETISGGLYAKDLTDMKIKQDVVNRALGACRLMMDGITYKDIETMTLMVGSASGLPGQFSDSDKVCAENAGIDYMDVITFVGK